MTQSKLTPEQQAVIRELNGLAHQLGTMPQPTRDKHAREAGWRKVLAARPEHSTKHPRLRVLIPAGSVVALLLVYLVAGAALPGQRLYALKRATEDVRDSLTFSAAGKAQNCSRYMNARANEFATLAKDEQRLPEDTVSGLIGDILQEAKEFEDYITQAPTDAQTELRTQRQSDAAAVASVLIKIDASTIPDSKQQQVKDAISTLRRIADG